MNIVLLSNHWYPSPRRAGFHHLAHAWHEQGHCITFVTTGISWISYARRDYRTKYKDLWQARNTMQQLEENFYSYVHFTPLHPHTTLVPFIDTILAPYLERYANYNLGALEAHIKNADIIVYESCNALYLLKLCKKINTHAKHIYRVSDDLRYMRSIAPYTLELEKKIAPLFDSISVPYTTLQEKFSSFPHVHLNKHGLSVEAFEQAHTSPYAQDTINAVFAGNARLDASNVEHMAKAFPHVHFHILGNVHIKKTVDNIHTYGEVPFNTAVAFIKFADIGLQTLTYSPAIAVLKESLKILQYRYCGLPIIAPDFFDLAYEGIFYYTPHDVKSCVKAVQSALESGKNPQRAQEVKTWHAVAKDIINENSISISS